jgi:hypothetical protein
VLEKIMVPQLVKFSAFTVPENSLPCLPEPTTGPYPEPDECSRVILYGIILYLIILHSLFLSLSPPHTHTHTHTHCTIPQNLMFGKNNLFPSGSDIAKLSFVCRLDK